VDWSALNNGYKLVTWLLHVNAGQHHCTCSVRDISVSVSDIDVCPSSIGTYFISSGFACTTGVHKMKPPKLHHILVPVIKSDVSDSEFCIVQDFYEWLGFLACSW